MRNSAGTAAALATPPCCATTERRVASTDLNPTQSKAFVGDDHILTSREDTALLTSCDIANGLMPKILWNIGSTYVTIVEVKIGATDSLPAKPSKNPMAAPSLCVVANILRRKPQVRPGQ